VKDPNYKPRRTIAIGGKKSKKQKQNETKQLSNSVMQMVEANLKRAMQGEDSSDDDGDQKSRKKKSRGKGNSEVYSALAAAAASSGFKWNCGMLSVGTTPSIKTCMATSQLFDIHNVIGWDTCAAMSASTERSDFILLDTSIPTELQPVGTQ
jgi:hypothetical protein